MGMYDFEDGYPCRYDPLFYHHKYEFDEIAGETDKAYLFSSKGHTAWVPKKLCRFLNKSKNTVYIFRKFQFNWIKQATTRTVQSLFSNKTIEIDA